MPGAHTEMLRNLLLVFAGGAVGTLLRAGIVPLIGEPANLPLGVLTVNLLGAFALGLLVGYLTRIGSGQTDHGLRLLFGTGLLGGFTTYSLLATGVAVMIHDGRLLAGVAYGFGSVVLGIGASWLGLLAAQVSRRPA